MAKKKPQQQPREVSPLEKLGLRVSMMIQAPKAQLERQVTIHRLDSDPDEAWDGVMDMIAEEEGIEQVFNDDGTVLLRWGLPTDGDVVAGSKVLEDVHEFDAPSDNEIPY